VVDKSSGKLLAQRNKAASVGGLTSSKLAVSAPSNQGEITNILGGISSFAFGPGGCRDATRYRFRGFRRFGSPIWWAFRIGQLVPGLESPNRGERPSLGLEGGTRRFVLWPSASNLTRTL